MIPLGVVVPAHDEEDLLADCLAGLRHAAATVADRARVRVLVVADACSDRTEELARTHGADVLALAAHNVGRARAAGASALLGAPDPVAWLATTDADSVVPPDWLAAQLAARGRGADAWVGTVEVVDWSGLPGAVPARYRAAYEADHRPGDPHRHVHGASLGVAAPAYRAVGGFPALPTGEDVALVERLDRGGHRVVRDRRHPVVTSARTEGRAPGGFAGHLRGLAMHVIPTAPGTTPASPRPALRREDDGPAARIS
ncbi:glycosyltransferase [Actinomycetospora lutea]|uniref:glycosyltransferase n=1 Tax=Actinomycetospora lutea TaxID=663604 RepID=UPI0023672C80|nr:glycosyltransferase [Actinomycetospora lutea]MDD7940304.1 glycosyltransferase [Actinomycetospora lutea]